MANKKISQLTAAAAAMKGSDLIEVSKDDGSGGYDSRSRTGVELFEGVIASTHYISAYSLTNQTFVGNVPTLITFDGTGFNNGLSLHTSTQILADQDGIYQLDFTATILNNGGNANGEVAFYLKINGTDVVDSSKYMNAPTNNHVISFQTSWLVEMNVLDFVEIFCVMKFVQFELISESSFTGLYTPSAQVIMKRIG